MIVFRLCKSIYAHDLSGRGAEQFGGRWNSKGTPMIYTGQSRALSTVEIAVHTPLGNLPNDYVLVTIEVPDNLHTKLEEITLPPDWQSFPHSDATQKIGDQFIRDGVFLMMEVPSAVVQGEYNYLINPNHPEFRKVKISKIEKFTFDERLFRK